MITVAPAPTLAEGLATIAHAQLFSEKECGAGVVVQLYRLAGLGSRSHFTRDAAVWLAHNSDGQAVGMALAARKWWAGLGAWYNGVDVYVLPKWRHQGIARQLLQAAHAACPALYGFHTKEAEALYTQMGIPDGFSLGDWSNDHFPTSLPSHREGRRESAAARAHFGVVADLDQIHVISAPNAHGLAQVRHEKLFDETQTGYGVMGVLYDLSGLGHWAGKVALRGLWLARHQNGCLVGMAMVTGHINTQIGGTTLILNTYVTPRWRGEGVGEKLIDIATQAFPNAYGHHTSSSEHLYRRYGVGDYAALVSWVTKAFGPLSDEGLAHCEEDSVAARVWLGVDWATLADDPSEGDKIDDLRLVELHEA